MIGDNTFIYIRKLIIIFDNKTDKTEDMDTKMPYTIFLINNIIQSQLNQILYPLL